MGSATGYGVTSKSFSLWCIAQHQSNNMMQMGRPVLSVWLAIADNPAFYYIMVPYF